ncbi:MAG: gamma-glutamylcyclotransferase family protein [Pseudomonadota bacterium]
MTGRYFAYGSNMNPARVRERGLALAAEPRAATLQGFRLCFDKIAAGPAGVGHANVLVAPGASVHGVLYELADAQEILKMDPFERAPINYGREAVQVECEGAQLWTWTYFANRACRAPGLRPSSTYLAHLLAGKPWLPSDYHALIAATETAEVA